MVGPNSTSLICFNIFFLKKNLITASFFFLRGNNLTNTGFSILFPCYAQAL